MDAPDDPTALAERALETPPALIATWTAGAPCGSSSVAGKIAVALERAWTLDGHTCDLKAVKSQTQTRWYVDLACGTEKRELDMTLVGTDRLLVADRPLGEAKTYKRCGP